MVAVVTALAETELAAEVVICQEKMEITTILKNPENLLEVRYIKSAVPGLGVKIRNLKVDFRTGGTWRRVGQ